MSKFKTLLEESIKNNRTQVIAESSMTRFLRKFEQYDGAIITAHRGNFVKRENQQRNRELFAMLNSKGYSITSVKGSYIENFGHDTQQEVSEHSFVVVNHNDDRDFINVILKLGEKFDQDSILEIKRGSPPAALLHGTSRREDAWPSYGQTHTLDKGIQLNNTNSQFFTRLGNAKLAFLDESTRVIAEGYNPDSVAGQHGLHLTGRKHWRDF